MFYKINECSFKEERFSTCFHLFSVEQYGTGPFNRAMLMNVGAAEALKQYDYQCFIFHDVDLLPEDDRNLVGPRNSSKLFCHIPVLHYCAKQYILKTLYLNSLVPFISQAKISFYYSETKY